MRQMPFLIATLPRRFRARLARRRTDAELDRLRADPHLARDIGLDRWREAQ